MATQAERLARIETLLEGNASTAQSVAAELRNLANKIEELAQAQHEDIADLAALKNKGTGILIGVGIAAAAMGASIATGFDWLIGMFK